MKYIKIGIVLCALLTFFVLRVDAQTVMKIDIKASIIDHNGDPVIGAVVSAEDGNEQALTNIDGVFVMQVDKGSKLKIEALGYNTTYANAAADLTQIILSQVAEKELVQVAYRKMYKEDVLGGVSSVSIVNNLDKNYTTSALDGMQAYIGGFQGNLWGMDGSLILVDGIPRDAEFVKPSEIEQISFLKGASATVLYGSRAAKGVIYITTKRGKAEEQRINVRANTGFDVVKRYPKYLGSGEYMSLYNEARQNDGLEALYSDETIYNYASGNNPFRYPDINYYSSDYLKKAYNTSDVTAEITGGNERAKFYTNISYAYSGGLIKFGEAEKDNSTRLNIRGNIDLKLNEYISSRINAAAIFYNGRSAHGDYWASASTSRPHRFAPLIPISYIEQDDENSWLMIENSNHLIDGKYLLGGSQLDQTNVFADIYASGYNKYVSRQFLFDAGVDFKLDNILKGLAFHTTFAIDYTSSYNQSYDNEYAVYEASWNNYSGKDLIGKLTKYGEDTKSGVQNIKDSWSRQTIAFSGYFDYKTTIEDNHNITAMLIANGFQQSESAVYHKVSNANLGLQLGYNLKKKYFFDFSGAVIHSAKLPSGNRQAFSPTFSLGWKISEEDFLSNSSAVDFLKLTASAGIVNTDLDISDYYLYESIYSQTDGAWYGWLDGASNQSTDSKRGENPNLTFAKRKEITFGVEGSLFDRLLSFDLSFFANRMTGKVIQASTIYPNYFVTGWPSSSFLPYINFNEDERIGVDFAMNFNKRIGAVDWTLGVAGTYNKSKAITRDELYEDKYQNRAGKPLDGLWGLKSAGLYQSDEEIANSPSHSFGEVKPGDIKYIDQNNDNVIDSKDEVYLGRAGWNGSPFTFGINLTAKWRDFTFFALGVGEFGANAMKNNSYFWVQGDGKYSDVVRGRWTEETKDTATYPRLTSLNSDNNFRSSDFWLYKTDRFNLAKVQITYDLPKQIFHKTFVRGLSLYVSGANLLTIAKERKILETNYGTAPQTRFYNFGLKAMF